MRPHGPWKIRANREAYRDPWLTVTVDDVVRPDGKEGTFSVVHIQPGVCVVAVDRDGIAYLTEEFRYAIGRPSIEGVSGGIDEGEEPLDAARRELREELGIDAARWTAMGTVDPFTSMTVSPTRLFLAEGLSFGEPRHEGTERIRRVTMLLAESVRAVLDGRITHAPTCVLLLKAALRVGTGWVEPEEQSVVRMAGPDGPRTRSRVVVIEDNYDAAESLRMLLETQGCEVAVAHTGPDGIAAARTIRPDVVFCDIGLPGLDGYEVARRLRSEGEGHRLVLVAVTAYGGEDARRRAEAAGFDLHFVKPADPAVLARLFKDVHARAATADPVI